jgi:hypothetical protein
MSAAKDPVYREVQHTRGKHWRRFVFQRGLSSQQMVDALYDMGAEDGWFLGVRFTPRGGPAQARPVPLSPHPRGAGRLRRGGAGAAGARDRGAGHEGVGRLS